MCIILTFVLTTRIAEIPGLFSRILINLSKHKVVYLITKLCLPINTLLFNYIKYIMTSNTKCKGSKRRLIQSAKHRNWGTVRKLPNTEERWIMRSLRETLRDLEEKSTQPEAANCPYISISLCVATEVAEGMQRIQNTSSSTLSDDKSNSTSSTSDFLTVPLPPHLTAALLAI